MPWAPSSAGAAAIAASLTAAVDIFSPTMLRPPTCRMLLAIEFADGEFETRAFLSRLPVLRCAPLCALSAEQVAALPPCAVQPHAYGSPNLRSRPARTLSITLCTIRSPMQRILVLVRAVHHDAVPPVARSYDR